jgi:sulfate adenylyltransferase subunit 1
VKAILLGEDRLGEAQSGQSVLMLLEDELDISRGDLFVNPSSRPAVAREIAATLCWLDESQASAGGRFLLRTGAREARCILEGIHSRLDLASLESRPAAALAMNDIAQVKLRLQHPIPIDPYSINPATGAFILVDEATNATVAAGLMR